MEKVVCISAAKVPIVKIWDPELGLACDMNVNNTVALENTRMIRTYVEIDPRVRKLAMIIKYWTRKRIINDAGKSLHASIERIGYFGRILTFHFVAFGGTLSSYTWICLIITFLQLRQPPVLPALHQLPYKMPRPDGSVGEFADNLKKLKGFGGKNKSSDAELLFQFFRFYAHEFDYDKHVLSVRQGKLITKNEKKWNYAINNQLCVEEPFNTSRNLGNTADEYSFRGLHMEIRRAFDLLSYAKLEEACEQFVFPKEEERVWSRPPQQPRPAMIRSSSQTHTGRGSRGNHRGGGRHNNYHRGGGGGGGASSRRTSSSVPTYDNALLMPGLAMPQDLAWYQASQIPFQYAQQDLMAQMAYQENMRQLHLYTQSPAFLQHQQSLAQQRLSASSASSQQSPSDRSRTNSFDNVPANGLLRPELYTMYGMNLNPQFYAQSQGAYGTYPSSPATAQGSGQDFRRSLQRATVTTDAGVANTGSSLRSQSQPATRSPSSTPLPPYPLSAQTSNTSYFTARSVNGVPIPNFMPDDTDFDETPKAVKESPAPDDSVSNTGASFTGTSSSPVEAIQHHQPNVPSSIAFGDITGGGNTDGYGLSTEDGTANTKKAAAQPPSRGHGRALSAGTASAPLPSRQFEEGTVSMGPPLVVNGSGIKTKNIAGSANTITTAPVDNLIPDMNNALRIQGFPVPPAMNVPEQQNDISERPQVAAAPVPQLNGFDPSAMLPMTEDASFRDRIAMMNSYYASGMNNMPTKVGGKPQATSQQRLLNRHPQSGLIAPLDLAINDSRLQKGHPIEAAHLSPVYETRTPSPSTQRKPEAPASFAEKLSSGKSNGKSTRLDTSTPKPTPVLDRALQPQDISKATKQAKAGAPQTQRTNAPRENGHVRSAKSESDGGWQKAGKNKKKVTTAANQTGQGEQPPKHEADRKGG